VLAIVVPHPVSISLDPILVRLDSMPHWLASGQGLVHHRRLYKRLVPVLQKEAGADS
jgi:hypothetical protein